MSSHETSEVINRNGEKYMQNSINGKEEVVPVSKIRQAIPQFCAVSAKNLLLLTFGSSLGFPTILIPELQKENPEIVLSLEELTWISSMNLFLVPIGSFGSGIISQHFGRRKTMMMTTIPFILSWLVYHYATNATMLFTALAITGLTGGLLEAPVMTYVAEITQPHLRGMLSATSTMAVIAGVFSQMLTGSLTTWRTLVLINIIYPCLCFIALSLVPESPEWLATKGRIEEAEKGLCWLRGWVSPAHIREEFLHIYESVQKPIAPAGTTESKKSWKPYLQKTFYVPFFLVSTAFFFAAFGGSVVLQTFAVVIFDKLNAPIDKYTATVFLGMGELVGTFICVCFIHFTGKRKLSFFSVGGSATCFSLAAIYGYLIQHNTIDGDLYTWIPTTLMIGAAFLSHVGIRMLPWILSGEVFPSDVRSIATGSAGSIGYIFSSIANKCFLYMMNGMTLSGTFVFYAVMNFLGCAILFFILPETEGRSLREIGEHFAGIHNLKDKPKPDNLAKNERWAFENPINVKDDESKL